MLKKEPGFKIRRIEEIPGGLLSLQSHEHRSEHWVVVAGKPTVSLSGNSKSLSVNGSTFFPVDARHRLENPASEPLKIIEVQVDPHLGKDDIRRFDDYYRRR